jgi:hypothetical protein
VEKYVTYTRLRLEAALRELDGIRDQAFAYSDVETAVNRIAKIFRADDRLLEYPSRRREDRRIEDCVRALRDIHNYLPFLGIIVRSAAVRNAFEVYGPLRKLARTLLADGSVRLVLSSGWDYYPLTFRPVEEFNDYVIIVLPSCESSNPLLLPLAGHELGHAVWASEELPIKLGGEFTRALLKHVHQSTRIPEFKEFRVGGIRKRFERGSFGDEASKWLARQMEEFFCDFVGLYLFGESYLHAFTYFLSPNFPGQRTPKYPSLNTRVEQLQVAAARFAHEWKSMNYELTQDARKMFPESKPCVRPGHPVVNQPNGSTPWRDAVDAVAISLVPNLLDKIVELGARENWKKLRDFGPRTRAVIRDKFFKWAVPAANPNSLADILNAAWDVERDDKFWDHLPSLGRVKKPEERELRRREILSELTLKNIEVLEYEGRPRLNA